MGDGGEVVAWPVASVGPLAEPPQRVYVAADHGLWGAARNLETQLGTLEAYNRLCAAAAELRAKIEAGEAKPANPVYVTRPELRIKPYPL